MTRSLTGALIAALACSATPARAQTAPAAAITGIWVGGLESNGEFAFYSATIQSRDGLVGSGSVPLRGLSGPLRSIRLDGARVRIEGPASVVRQGGWIAPLAAVRFGAAAFVMTLSGGRLTPAHGELLDSEWELRKAGFGDAAVGEALAFQTAKNQFMRTGSGWEDYAALRARATDLRAPWYAHPGTDLSGPQSAALAEGGNRDFTAKVFPNGRHNLMDMTGAAPNEFARLERFVPGLFDLMASWLVERARPLSPGGLDLRANAGGSPETAAFLASYFFDTPGLPLFEIVHRTRTTMSTITVGKENSASIGRLGARRCYCTAHEAWSQESALRNGHVHPTRRRDVVDQVRRHRTRPHGIGHHDGVGRGARSQS